MLEKLKQSSYLKAFLLSMLLAMIIIVPRIIVGGGILNIVDDFDYQEIPFNIFINDWIKNGGGLWNWHNDLGSSFIGSFSFYNLSSPFVLIGLLFPSSWFPYLVGPIFILKYAVAGLTSYMFLKRYVKNQKYAIIGSLLYSFSGFQITNMLFYHFHDIVAFFPLVLWSLDKLVLDNKKIYFALSVALIVFTNYFFFIGIAIFCIIYFVVKLLTKEYIVTWTKFIQIAFEALLGIGISAVILLPSLVFVLGNPRVGGSWNFINAFVFSIGRYVDIIRAFIMPSEIMSYRAMVVSSNYRSVELFLPFIGSIFTFSYIFKNKKSWITKLILVCIVCMFVPILNSVFTAFQTHYYARWFFMPILFFSLASIKAMEDGISIKNGVKLTSIIAIIGVLVGIFYQLLAGDNFVRDMNYFVVIITLFLICLITNIHLKKTRGNEDRYLKKIVIGIFIFVAIMGNLFFYQYKHSSKNDDLYVDMFLGAKKYLEIDNKDYERIDVANGCYPNLGTILNKPVIKSFNSSLNGSLFDFYYSIDNKRFVTTRYENSDFDLRNFVSVKYFITCNDKDKEYYQKYYKEISQAGIYTVFENENYYPMGIVYDYYILKENFEELETEEKKKMLLKAVVVEEHLDYLEEIADNCIFDSSCIASKNFDSKFEYTKNKFTDTMNIEKTSLVLYTVPKDSNWEVIVNGEVVDIVVANSGFMALKLDVGKNEIVFNYVGKDFKYGAIVSISSLICLMGYGMIRVKKRSNEK